MTLPQVRGVIQDPKAELESIDSGDTSGCTYLRSDVLSQDLGVMFFHRRVVRIDINGPSIRTASGAGVGDTEDGVKSLYSGLITVQPHHYIENGHYLNYKPRDPAQQKYGMVFETENGKVTSFRTGTHEAIALVEGCAVP
jgi:hypothetical protein